MPFYRRYLLFVSLACIVALLPMCAKKEKSSEKPITQPMSQPMTEDHPGANVEGFVWGYMPQDQPDKIWQKDLYENLIKEIDWGLTARKADTTNMAEIPAGTSRLGCAIPPRTPQECLPYQERRIKAFWIDRYEVTNAEYNRCVQEHMCLPPMHNAFIVDGTAPDRPALISYKQAERYCLWAGKRLPSEYEWERAARGDDGRLYSWGRDEPMPQHANICGVGCPMPFADATWDDGFTFTSPVTDFALGDSPYGLRQVSGNVKEWTTTEEELAENHYIARGSSWYSDRPELFVFYRQVWQPGTRVDDKGVRCAMTLRR